MPDPRCSRRRSAPYAGKSGVGLGCAPGDHLVAGARQVGERVRPLPALQERDASRARRRAQACPSHANANEIERCRIWLDLERAIVKPAAIVALGATAARDLFGRPVTIGKLRGQTLHLADGTAAFVTIHPSWLLRMEGDADQPREYDNFVADLGPAASVLRKAVA